MHIPTYSNESICRRNLSNSTTSNWRYSNSNRHPRAPSQTRQHLVPNSAKDRREWGNKQPHGELSDGSSLQMTYTHKLQKTHTPSKPNPTWAYQLVHDCINERVTSSCFFPSLNQSRIIIPRDLSTNGVSFHSREGFTIDISIHWYSTDVDK